MATEKTPLLPDGGPEKTTTSSKRSGWSAIFAGAAVGVLAVFCIWRFSGSGKGPALIAVIPGQDKADKADVSGCAPVLPAADENDNWTLPNDPDDAYGAKSAADAKYAHGDGVDEDELPGIMARTSFSSIQFQNQIHPPPTVYKPHAFTLFDKVLLFQSISPPPTSEPCVIGVIHVCVYLSEAPLHRLKVERE